jgi:uncharacterized membrane protein YoaK (UPF0700 family)
MVAASFGTGLVDGGTYVVLQHVFIANQTGNLIFVGLGVAGHSGFPVVRSALSLVGFALGAAIGGLVQRRASVGRHAGPILVVVGLVLAAAGFTLVGDQLHGAALDVLTAAFACAMGAQASAARVVAVADVPTVVVTSTLASLAAEPWFGRQRADRTGRRASAIGAMLVGAVLGALLARAAPWLPTLAAGLVLIGVGAEVSRLQRAGYRTAMA